ncbi:MAG TPA: DUF4238 domain-containing protein [Phycisphaerae bacterium]|nr:DUF4238 domain-containing protein [Phycisphaerae bacterium]
MSRPKRQHYVPQFVLRRFAVDGDSDRVWVFDKLRGEARLQAIRDSAHETYFYERADLSRVGLNLEAKLAEFEGAVAPILETVCNEQSLLSITADTRLALVDFALVQLFRTRAAREFAKQGAQASFGIELDEDTAQQASFASLLRDFSRYRALCVNHILTLREALPAERFLLGDSVTLLVRPPDGPKDTLTTILTSATILVPIAPALCLMFFPAMREADLAEAGEWYRQDIRTLTEPQPTMPTEAESTNTMSVVAANRFLYSPVNEFSVCVRTIAAYPTAVGGPIGGWEEARPSGGG